MKSFLQQKERSLVPASTIKNKIGFFLIRLAFILGIACVHQQAKSQLNFSGVSLGQLTDYLFVFTNGSSDANWQAASKGYIGDVAINGILAKERTSGNFGYKGRIYTNDNNLGAYQNIVNNNSGQASRQTNQASRLAALQSDLTIAFSQINAKPVSPGFAGINSSTLNGLNTQNNIAEVFVINITSGFSVTEKINITGDMNDQYFLRWDTDQNFANGYNGKVKFSSGGAIVPLGGLKPTNFVHVAGDLGSSGGGNTPASPYPQGPRDNDGAGALINNGSDFKGGGFFTGYWLTTGDPANGQTSSLSNAIFVGGWYSNTTKFSMTSGCSGVYVSPPAIMGGFIGSRTSFQNGDESIEDIAEETKTTSLQVYPNPVINIVTVKLPTEWENKKLTYEIYNSTGQLLNKFQYSSYGKSQQLDLGKFHGGWYILKVSCEGKTAQQKIIKQ